jgi:hypothetical protein
MKYKKYILLLFILTFTLIVSLVAISRINNLYNVEIDKSTFTDTSFDIKLNSPSLEQIEVFKSSKDVEDILPLYLFELDLLGNNRRRMNLMFYESLESYDIGFFNEDRLLEGEFSSDGLLLDSIAAKKLNVSVGDNVSFGLNNEIFVTKVIGIFVHLNYPLLDDGLGFLFWSEDYKNAFPFTIKPQLALVKLNDINTNIFNNYKPLALLRTLNEFIEQQSITNPKPSYYTQEEWDELLTNTYEIYESNFLNQTYTTSVEYKREIQANILLALDEKINSYETENFIFAISLSLLFLVTVSISYYFDLNVYQVQYKSSKKIISIQKAIIIKNSIFFSFSLLLSALFIFIYSLFNFHKFYISMFSFLYILFASLFLFYLISFSLLVINKNLITKIK